MTTSDARSHRRARVADPDDEIRYRAAGELDPADAAERELLGVLLGDSSWRVRSAAVERLAGAADAAAVLPVLLARLSGGENVGARDAAAAALVRRGAEVVAPLIERLDGSDPDLRQAAASVLGPLGDRRAVAPLAARLADPDPNVRFAAAEALGRIGGPEAVATLLAALDSDEGTLRLAALEALGVQRVSPPVRRVEALLGDRALRRPAYRSLGASDEPGAAALLARGLLEPSRGAREAALAGVGQQRSRRTSAELEPLAEAVRAAVQPEAAAACAAALGSEEPFVAVGALAVLGWTGAVAEVGALLAAAEEDRLRPYVEEVLEALPRGPALQEAVAAALEQQGPFGRITALAVLAGQGSPAALESLAREASDPDGYLQAEAIAALGRLRDPRAVAPLAGLLGDDAPAVSGIAATALVRLGQESPRAREAALAALRDRAGASPSAALFRVLGALGDTVDVERLRAGLGRLSVVQRMAAAGAISTLAQRGALAGQAPAELAGALGDAAWSVRAAAARAFLELARRSRGAEGLDLVGAAGVRRLEGALADPEPAVRAVVVEALGACGRPEHAAAIAAVARERDLPPVVAVGALRALVALGGAPEDVVERAIGSADPEVVKEGVAAAASLPGDAGVRLLRAAAASPRWDVRQAVARAVAGRGDPALRELALERSGSDPDPLVARAFAEAAGALSGRAAVR
ncbi:MAG: HEAT repeat domain-containing protein [Anaeromyxobacter sp.]